MYTQKIVVLKMFLSHDWCEGCGGARQYRGGRQALIRQGETGTQVVKVFRQVHMVVRTKTIEIKLIKVIL